MDRNTPRKDGELVAVPVAAETVIHAGTLVMVLDGYAMPPETIVDTDPVIIGVADEYVDNSEGGDGDLVCRVWRKKVFLFENDSDSDWAVTQKMFGKAVFATDGSTVAKAGQVVAGTCLGVGPDGVWVEVA